MANQRKARQSKMPENMAYLQRKLKAAGTHGGENAARTIKRQRRRRKPLEKPLAKTAWRLSVICLKAWKYWRIPYGWQPAMALCRLKTMSAKMFGYAENKWPGLSAAAMWLSSAKASAKANQRKKAAIVWRKWLRLAVIGSQRRLAWRQCQPMAGRICRNISNGWKMQLKPA